MRVTLSVPQDFLDALSAIGGIFYGAIKHRQVTAICTDSRECQDGDLFFALSGENFNGNNFIDEAIQAGAIPVGPSVKTFGIKISSGNSALLNFAKFYKKRLPYLRFTVAITGSVGKTTTKEFLSVLSRERYKTHATWQNFNNEIGVPLTILSAPLDTEVLICELGMNHRGEIRQLSDTVEPDIAVITKIGTAHIGNLGSIQEIANAKLEITSGLRGPLLLPYGECLLKCDYPKIATHSANNNNATVSTIKNQFGLLEIYVKRELTDILNFRFDGNHLYECLAAAACAANVMKIPHRNIIDGISKINNSNLRHQILKTPLGFYILDDSYNSSYESLLASFELLSNLKGYSGKSVLLGDILELGDQSETIHAAVGQMVTKYRFDNLFLIGEQVYHIAESAISNGFPKNKIFINSDIHSPEITSAYICQNMKPNEILLAKASHKMNLRRIINLITGNQNEK